MAARPNHYRMIRLELSPARLSHTGSTSPPRTSCDLNLDCQSALPPFSGSLVFYSVVAAPSRPVGDFRSSRTRRPGVSEEGPNSLPPRDFDRATSVAHDI